MSYYVVRSDNDLAHHGILGMKWGVWNDETRARRTGSRARKKKKYDYSDLSDADLQKKLNRKRNEDQLRQLEKKEEPKSVLQLTEDGARRLRNVIGALSGVAIATTVLAKKYPEMLNAFEVIKDATSNVDASVLYSLRNRWVL